MEIIKVKNFFEVPKNFTGVVEFLNGNKYWYKNRKFHREDGPAVEHLDGYKEWWIEGQRHRTDGPAVEFPNGYKEWWIEGKNYSKEMVITLTKTSIFLGKEKGKYNLEWLRFLTDQGIQEFPIILGMNIRL
jgi:hypothetical protein